MSSSDSLQRIAAPLIVAAIIGALSLAVKVATLEAQLAAIEGRVARQEDRTDYLHGAETR